MEFLFALILICMLVGLIWLAVRAILFIYLAALIYLGLCEAGDRVNRFLRGLDG